MSSPTDRQPTRPRFGPLETGALRADEDSVATALELVEMLYALDEDRSNWLRFLERLRRWTGCDTAILRTSNQDTGKGEMPLGIPFDPQQMRAYQEAYHPAALEVFRPGNPLFVEPGRVATRRMAVDDERWAASRLYRDYFAHHGWFHLLNAVIDVDGPLVYSLTLNRTRAQGPFSEATIRWIGRLVPHLRRCLRLQHQLSRLADANTGLRWALEHVPVGVVLAAVDGRVVGQNETATRILSAGDGLRLEGGRLIAEPAASDERLQALLAAAGNDERAGATQARLTLERGQRAPLQVLVFPAGQAPPGPGPQAGAAIFLCDPERHIQMAPAALAQLYGLTPAESRLAGLLVSGTALTEAAVELGVSHQTVRTHLKRIFTKTGTKRQAELVGLLLSGVEALQLFNAERPKSG